MPKHFLNKLNAAQRVGVFVWFMALISVLVLHNPLDGYEITYKPNYMNAGYWSFGETPRAKLEHDCYLLSESALSDLKAGVSYSESVALARMDDKKCFDNHLLPLEEWESAMPLVPWFGSVVHLLWSGFLITVIALAWIFIFKSPTENLPQ